MNARTAMDILVAMLRGRAPEHEISGDDWAALIRLSQQYRVLWLLQERIETLRFKLPFIASQRLLHASRQDAAANLRQIAALLELLRAMSEAKLRILPLKGPAMLERLYGDANRRPCADLDVLIRLEDLKQCNAVLKSLGYEEKWLGEPYKWTWLRGPIMIEVHSDFDERPALDFPMAPVWDRVCATEFQGQPAWKMSAADELVFLCLHAARHQFASLSLMVELQRAFAILGEGMNDALPDWYKARTVPGVVLLAKAMTERMMDVPVKLNIKVDARVQQKIPAMVSRLWAALMQQEALPKTRLGIYRFLRELEPRWTARAAALWKQSWMSAERVSVDDVARAKSVGVTSKWGQRCIRQVRLVVIIVRRCAKR